MVTLYYLSILNSETKEKLIGSCLNRKLIESFNEDGETMYEEDKQKKMKKQMMLWNLNNK